jgi:hypothetical protein
MGGLGYRLAPGRRAGGAIELQVPAAARSTSAVLPLGSDVRASTGYVAMRAGLRAEF